MKYSSTDSPSRKFDLIGLSMISPMPPVSFFCGFAIRPRIPTSWRIWSREPRLPESNIMNTGLNPPLERCMVHHGVRDVVVRVRPGVDHLVVALAERDLAGGVRPLEPLDPAFGIVQQARLLGRDLQVLDPDRHATHGRVAEAELLQIFEELHRAREPSPPVAVEHQLRQVALAHHLVEEPLPPDALGE